MEIVLILTALAVLAVSGVTVAAMAGRSRRPPLRLPREDDIAEDSRGTEDFDPPVPSPIDRTGAVIDLDPIEPRRRLDGPPGPQP